MHTADDPRDWLSQHPRPAFPSVTRLPFASLKRRASESLDWGAGISPAAGGPTRSPERGLGGISWGPGSPRLWCPDYPLAVPAPQEQFPGRHPGIGRNSFRQSPYFRAVLRGRRNCEDGAGPPSAVVSTAHAWGPFTAAKEPALDTVAINRGPRFTQAP